MWQQLRECIRAGDRPGVVAVLEPLDEAQRRALREAVAGELTALTGQQAAHFRRLQDERVAEINHLMAEEGVTYHEAQRAVSDRARGQPSGPNPYEAPLAAADLARFGVNPPGELGWQFQYSQEGDYERLARSRDRRWRQAVADGVALPIAWILRMARDGLVERPASEEFVVATIIDESVVGDPEWRETELWRYFEIEAAGDVLSSYPRETWTERVCAAARAGDVSRTRLLDAALAGLRRDFAFKSTRWHRAVYSALEPTSDEHAQRAADLMALLASDDKLNVGLALDALTAAAAEVPAHDLLDALEHVLTHPVQKHAAAAVRLAGVVLETHPEAPAAGVRMLVAAVSHEKRAVQAAALKLLERHAESLGDDDREQLAAYAGAIDPGLRSRALALSGGGAQDAEVAPDGEPPPIPPATSPDRLAPRLRDEDLLEPIATPEELLGRALDALQGEPDIDEIELVIDAIFRFAGQPLDEERVDALLDSQRVMDPGRQVAYGVLRSVLYAQRRDGQAAAPGTAGHPALSLRLMELHHPVQAPRQLMSIPTHRGGWIDPRIAVARATTTDERPWRVDFAQMLLRLAPDHRAEALEAVGPATDAVNALLSHALGGPAATLADVHGDVMLLDAAQRARVPDWPADPWHPHSGPHRLNSAARDWVLTRALPAACPAGLLGHLDAGDRLRSGRAQQLLRVWPANRERCYRMVALRLWLSRHPDDPDDGLPAILAALLDPAEPVGEHATLALAYSFAADDALLRTLAVDVAIAVLAGRRCDGAALGTALARVLRDRRPAGPRGPFDWDRLGDLKLTRWAEPFGQVADAGPLHAHDVQIMLERVLAAAGESDRRGLAGCVQLLRRLALDADAAVTDEGARRWLEGYSPRTAGGRSARELLAVTGTGAARSHAAVAHLGRRSVER